MVRASTVCSVVCALAGVLAVSGESVAQATAKPATQEYLFPSGAGVLFFHVRPDRTDDFEAIVKRLSESLERSFDPVRRLQANHWRIYKSAETPRDAVIYLFFFDPAVVGADYDPIKVLSEEAPTELSVLFERLKATVVRVERMGLRKLR